jgi:pimeloyl-ACP methyl ester carboxylesterase
MYRREMSAARARVGALERHVVPTPWGAVEYAERGAGDPVLVIHGIFQHCFSGLLSVRDLFTNRRLIAPSRFGYLGSSMPPNATPAAQADAFAALMNALGIHGEQAVDELGDEPDVVGRHRERSRNRRDQPGRRWRSERL